MSLTKDQIKEMQKFLCIARKTYSSFVAPLDAKMMYASGDRITTFKDGDWKYHDTFFGEGSFSGITTISYKDVVVWTMIYSGEFLTKTSPSLIKFCIKKALENVDIEAPWRGPNEYTVQNGLYRYTNSFEGDITDFSGNEIVSILTNNNKPYDVYHMAYKAKIIEQ